MKPSRLQEQATGQIRDKLGGAIFLGGLLLRQWGSQRAAVLESRLWSQMLTKQISQRVKKDTK